MELLLELFWVISVVPTALIWRRERRFAQHSVHLCFSPSFVSLVCVLVLLFPVVSATDDMRVMRAEIEESSPTKRLVKQSASWTFQNDGLHRCKSILMQVRPSWRTRNEVQLC
jgi:hypothetical protein